MCEVQDLEKGLNLMETEKVEKFNNDWHKFNENRSLQHKIIKYRLLDGRDIKKQHTEKLIDLEDRSRRNNLNIDCLGENQ